MIQLKADCLIFQTSGGEQVPCSAEWVTLELMGDKAELLDPELVENASAAVLHYFKHELNQQFVSVGEFAQALETVLRGLGLKVCSEKYEPHVAESDLRTLAHDAGKGCELFFFPTLREEMKRKLRQSPAVLRFRGLRGCVKQLSGSARWNRRCDKLNDQIVDYLRECWSSEEASESCALVVL